jgi:hypothetical protein
MSGKMSRGSALKGVGALLAGAGLTSMTGTRVFASAGNSDCAHYCTDVYPPGPDRGSCVSQAAHGTGACYTCGPAGAGGGNCNVGFSQCPGNNPNGLGCYCFTTTEGDGICAANSYCSQIPTCNTSADCAAGSLCITSNGCNACANTGGVCVPLCSSSGAGAQGAYAQAPAGATAIG